MELRCDITFDIKKAFFKHSQNFGLFHITKTLSQLVSISPSLTSAYSL